jgi:hypothetical protein
MMNAFIRKRARASIFILPPAMFAAVALAFSSACVSDPVPDAEIESLGPDVTDPGPDHRPGQPCVICHSSTGPASDDPFAVAGTVFHDNASAVGVAGVKILFVDSNGSAPLRAPTNDILTSASGNFYVRQSEWNPAFPLYVNIFNPADGTTGIMQSHIGRQPSCASCHRDAFTQSEQLYSVGHIYLYHANITTPTDGGAVGGDGGGVITDGGPG